MLDVRALAANVADAEAALKKRGGGEKILPFVKEIVALDGERRKAIGTVEALKNRKNLASQEIAKKKKSGEDASAILEDMKTVAAETKKLDERLTEIEAKLQTLLYEVPNLPDAAVPAGAGAEQNVEIKRWGEPRKF